MILQHLSRTLSRCYAVASLRAWLACQRFTEIDYDGWDWEHHRRCHPRAMLIWLVIRLRSGECRTFVYRYLPGQELQVAYKIEADFSMGLYCFRARDLAMHVLRENERHWQDRQQMEARP